MMISVRRVTEIEYDIEVTESKTVPARIPYSIYLLLEKYKNKSEFIRNVIFYVINNNIDLTQVSLSTERRRKIITFRVEYSTYQKMIQYAQRYQSINDFVNRAITWGIVNDVFH